MQTHRTSDDESNLMDHTHTHTDEQEHLTQPKQNKNRKNIGNENDKKQNQSKYHRRTSIVPTKLRTIIMKSHRKLSTAASAFGAENKKIINTHAKTAQKEMMSANGQIWPHECLRTLMCVYV